MATGAADILTHAVKKLTDFLLEEATFLLGAKDDVVWVRLELILMLDFVKDAEQKQGNDERIRQWIAEIRSIALETEDIIDDYYTEFKGKELSNQKFSGIILYNIGDEIKAVKKRLSDIKSKREVYGIITTEIADAGSLDQLRLRQRRRTTSLTDEEDFVGFDVDVKLLEEKLLSNEQSRSVISIYGMGGSGKTSLAWKLYNTVECEFELHAWICVSQEWNTRDLLEKIVKSFKKPTDDEELQFLKNLDVDDMERYLFQLLKDKRYLLVIDDMWDKEAWECLRNSLSDYKNRSRVIITTRSILVVDFSDEKTYVHNLRRLHKDESWELFCKNAFSNQNGARSGDLEEIGKEMVAMCDGLPLAIIVGFCQKNNVMTNGVSLLGLSYNDLAQELKSCFLYLGFFPEDYEIDTEKLVQLWIATDLIPSAEGRNLEEYAESYIEELNARSLIQLNRTHYDPTSTCRVHDLVRDFALKEAEDEFVNPNIRPLRSGFERSWPL